MPTAQMTRLVVTCVDCGARHEILAPAEDVAAWNAGKLIQHALPYLTDDDRELLVSQTCGACWDKLFTDDA